MYVTDNHSLCVRARGYTADEVRSNIHAWLAHPAVRQYRMPSDYVDIVIGTNRRGEFQDFAYIYLSNPKLYNIFLGLQPDGLKGVLVPSKTPRADPLQKGGKAPERIANWADEVDEVFPPRMLKELPPVMEVTLELEPARVLIEDYCSYLKVGSLPAHISAEDIWKLCRPYSNDSAYPRVHRCYERAEAVVQFAPERYDANFAAFFLHKVEVAGGGIAVFTTVHDPPRYKTFESFPKT